MWFLTIEVGMDLGLLDQRVSHVVGDKDGIRSAPDDLTLPKESSASKVY